MLTRRSLLIGSAASPLASALPAAAKNLGDWQPIETAPRDGKHCYLGWEWVDAEGDGCHIIVVWDTDDGLWHDGSRQADPLYWMPLPAFPALSD